ncbi:heat shock protein 70 [Anopheles sinensis]|uniref:Heat shock protein 70 n=1 Tax=Anopheles sinensis TaxID=74873 RepID=A0A084VLY5_ANOSI|nr:heat shock protein 70 [Anopheles sinensis]
MGNLSSQPFLILWKGRKDHLRENPATLGRWNPMAQNASKTVTDDTSSSLLFGSILFSFLVLNTGHSCGDSFRCSIDPLDAGGCNSAGDQLLAFQALENKTRPNPKTDPNGSTRGRELTPVRLPNNWNCAHKPRTGAGESE